VTADASEASFPAESFQAVANAPTVPKSPFDPSGFLFFFCSSYDCLFFKPGFRTISQQVHWQA
jgi:hypothetical protein